MTGRRERHVVVTGGTGALGVAVVQTLLEEGAVCHVPWRREEAMQAAPWRDHDRVRLHGPVDLADEDAVVRFYEQVPALQASVHVAGAFAMGALTDTSLDDFRRMHDANAVSCFLCCREAVRRFRATREGAGRLVNVAAKPALVPAGGLVAYTTAKAAVASMTRCLAEELSSEGIWVNAVVPSVIDTPPNREGMPGADHDAWPSPEEIAETVRFLASPDNRVTRGALVPVYGRT
ncbi:MAG: SDR family NAD(P)-dependent oxidoreductase [Myxococcota bacterium]